MIEPTAPGEGDPRLRIMHAEVRDQVDEQLRQIEALDAKAGILTALSGGIAVGLLAFVLSVQDLRDRGHGEISLLIEAAVATVTSIGAAYVALWPRSWRRDPNPLALQAQYEADRYRTTDTLLGELIAGAQASHARNQPGIAFKSRWVKYAQAALGGAFVLAVAVAIAHVSAW